MFLRFFLLIFYGDLYLLFLISSTLRDELERFFIIVICFECGLKLDSLRFDWGRKGRVRHNERVRWTLDFKRSGARVFFRLGPTCIAYKPKRLVCIACLIMQNYLIYSVNKIYVLLFRLGFEFSKVWILL